MAVIERQTVIATKDKDGNTVMHCPVTSAKYVEGAVRTVNGIEPDANGDVVVAGLPVGHIYFSLEKTVPTGTLPLNGGTYAHLAYIDLWNYILEQGNYLTFDEWQAMYDANGGNVPFYAITQFGSQSQWRFRVPSINGWVKGASSLEEVGSYLEAGLPNITGSFNFTNDSGAATGFSSKSTASGAFGKVEGGSGKVVSMANSSAYRDTEYNIDASRSSAIYGNSDTVQPPSIVGMWLVKAFGTVSNVGNQDIADISAGLTRVENKMNEYTDNVAYIEAFIVETWRSDDGSSWYRKYSDGWLEQGGTFGSGTSGTITFPKAFSAEVYLTFGVDCEATSRDKTAFVYTESLTGFTWGIADSSRGYWRASGR